jgi:hypothetical protein
MQASAPFARDKYRSSITHKSRDECDTRVSYTRGVTEGNKGETIMVTMRTKLFSDGTPSYEVDSPEGYRFVFSKLPLALEAVAEWSLATATDFGNAAA